MAGLKKLPKLGAITNAAPAAAAPPPPTTAQGRPSTIPRPTLFPQGPAVLGLGQRRKHGTGGPGVKPVDFPGTEPEWVWFFASARLHDDPEDPRVGPFVGGSKGQWQFADPIAAGVVTARTVGGSTPDFIYLTTGGEVIVRIQGFHWHTAAPAAQQARDLYNSLHVGNTATRLESVEDGEFMSDPTGGTAVRLLADILAGRSRIGAISSGLAMPPRYNPELQGGAA